MANEHSADIKANIPALRSVATQLASLAQDIEALMPDLKNIQAAAHKEASTNTIDGGPAPVYSPLLTALATATQKVGSNIDQLHQNVSSDAAALMKLANDLEGTDQGHGQRITNISTT